MLFLIRVSVTFSKKKQHTHKKKNKQTFISMKKNGDAVLKLLKSDKNQ